MSQCTKSVCYLWSFIQAWQHIWGNLLDLNLLQKWPSSVRCLPLYTPPKSPSLFIVFSEVSCIYGTVWHFRMCTYVNLLHFYMHCKKSLYWFFTGIWFHCDCIVLKEKLVNLTETALVILCRMGHYSFLYWFFFQCMFLVRKPIFNVVNYCGLNISDFLPQ